MSLAAPADFRPARAGSRVFRVCAAPARLVRAAADEIARARRCARTAFRLSLFALSLAMAMAFLAASARAGERRTLIIPPDDGYGFEDCLATNSACGAMAAAAWCQANGMKSAERFGRAEELDAEALRAKGAAPGSFYVSCADAS